MKETLRGALLSVLFFGGLALLAAPAAAQGGGGTMECDEENGSVECDDEITVTDTPLPPDPDPPPPDPPKPPKPPEDPEPPPKERPTIGPQTKKDKEADEEHQKKKKQEEKDRRTAQCTMWATSLSALQEYYDLGNCGSFTLNRKKSSTCSDLAQKIDKLAAKVAGCTP